MIKSIFIIQYSKKWISLVLRVSFRVNPLLDSYFELYREILSFWVRKEISLRDLSEALTHFQRKTRRVE